MAVGQFRTRLGVTRLHCVVVALAAFALGMGLLDEIRADEPIKTTIYADDNYRPFSYQQDGVAHGLYVQVLQRAFAQMKGFDISIVAVPWDRGKLMVKQGKAFGLAPAFYHGHDWPYMYPYSQPFYTETIRVYCQEEILSGQSRVWPGGFEGLRIGNVQGFDGWGSKAFYDMVDQGRIRYQKASGSQQLIQQARRGHHDCILMEESAFQFLIKTLPAVAGEAPTPLIKWLRVFRMS